MITQFVHKCHLIFHMKGLTFENTNDLEIYALKNEQRRQNSNKHYNVRKISERCPFISQEEKI